MKLRNLIRALALMPHAALADEIGPAALLSLPQTDVVILGEVHDNPQHHANQAVAVAGLRPAALVFEMLTPQQAAAATPTARISATALSAALQWEASGWPEFALYFPIFVAAPDAVILGGAMPGDAARQAVSDGAASVFGSQAQQFGLTDPLPAAEQAVREAEQMAAHCNAMPPELLAGMVEAQRLRDAALARAVMPAFAETGGPVAVITGTGHARRDWGVPAVLARAAPGLAVLSIGQLESAPGPDAPFDYWLVTLPAPREDPCAAFAAD